MLRRLYQTVRCHIIRIFCFNTLSLNKGIGRIMECKSDLCVILTMTGLFVPEYMFSIAAVCAGIGILDAIAKCVPPTA